MLQRGDWIVPTFNGELRAHKPALLYWLIMASYRVFGVSEFSARFGSALVGTGTVLVTYFLGKRLLPGKGGLWSALVLATMILFSVSSRSATPDAPLIFFGTLGLAFFAGGYFPALNQQKRLGRSLDISDYPPKVRKKTPEGCFEATASHDLTRPKAIPWPSSVLMYTSFGLAVLAKGPVGVVLPLMVIGVFLLIENGRACGLHMQPGDNPAGTPADTAGPTGHRLWARVSAAIRLAAGSFPRSIWQITRQIRLGTGLVIALAVALPWYLAVTYRTEGAFLREFIFRHHLERALAADGRSPRFDSLLSPCLACGDLPLEYPACALCSPLEPRPAGRVLV